MYVCSFFVTLVVILQVSAPYNKTVLMFKLKILIFALVDISDEFQIFFKELNAHLALLTLS